MFDLLAVMTQQPQTRGSSKGSEQAAPVTMAPARLLQLGPQKNNLWASLSWKDASFWGRHGSPSHRDGNSPWYQLPGRKPALTAGLLAACAGGQTLPQPLFLHQGCCEERSPLPANALPRGN